MSAPAATTATTDEPRAFVPRPIVPHGVLAADGWRLKRYAITLGDATLDWDAFAPGLALAASALPRPDAAAGCYGAGFVVAHRGRGVDYVVLGWWSAENELPVRVVVRPQAPGASWRAARDDESFCVWDLQVIAHERDAWVDAVLSPDPARAPLAARIDAYLACTLAVPAHS